MPVQGICSCIYPLSFLYHQFSPVKVIIHLHKHMWSSTQQKVCSWSLCHPLVLPYFLFPLVEKIPHVSLVLDSSSSHIILSGTSQAVPAPLPWKCSAKVTYNLHVLRLIPFLRLDLRRQVSIISSSLKENILHLDAELHTFLVFI